MVRSAWWSLGMLLIGSLAPAGEAVPVLVYDLGTPPGTRLVRDRSGGGTHARLPAGLAAVPSPTGQAALFDGTTAITAPPSSRLIRRESLTLDVWLRVDEVTQQGCVLDKQGEVYRLAVVPEGRFYVGLKGERERVDLYGSGMVPGQWHRITATFQRPELRLYLDGRLVGEESWDHAIDPGGALHLGAKGGRYDRFVGAIDQVHLYDQARAPQPGDETRYLSAGGEAVKPRLQVSETATAVSIDTGALTAALSRGQGALLAVQAGEKALVRTTDRPPVSASIVRLDGYDGSRDAARPSGAAGAPVEGRWECRAVRLEPGDGVAAVRVEGRLGFAGQDGHLEIALDYRFTAGARRVGVDLAVRPVGAFNQVYLRHLAMEMPLTLDERKRVVLMGDQGVREDIRYRYDFHTHVRFLTQPDRNTWRYFQVDQESPTSVALRRSESLSTAALTGFRGRQAPGWMTAYDRSGGVTLAYRDPARRAPKCLEVDAADGGTGRVCLLAPSHPAAPLQADLAPELFGAPHRLDWVFFAGEECLEQPEQDLRDAWQADGWQPEPAAAALPGAADAWPRLDTTAALWAEAAPGPAELTPMVESGVPLPRGAVTAPDQVRLFAGAAEVPLDTRALAYWPDQSIKWLLLIFPRQPGGVRAAPGRGDGREAALRLTTRAGGDAAESYRLVFGSEVRRGALEAGVAVRREGDQVSIDTGPLQVRLRPGRQWLAGLRCEGRERVRDDGQAQAFVDFFRPGPEGYATGTTHPQGVADPGPVAITRIDVEESDGLRAVVRLEGLAEAAEPARVILRLEAWAGRPLVKITHTVEFLHDDPRTAFVRRLGLRLPLALDPAASQCRLGGSAIHEVAANGQVGLRQDSHLASRVWRRAPDAAWPEILGNGAQSRGWLQLQDASGGLSVVQRDFWQEAPKELRYDAAGQALEILYWPDSAPLMDCRRYSLYPHQGQGESTPADQRWVVDKYYTQDPFKGVSRSHETWLVCHPSGAEAAAVAGVAADIQSRPLLYAGWPWYAETGVTMPLAPADGEAFARLNRATVDLADWWLFHQRAWGWYGMWDYGDVQHHYRSGYGRIFPPETLASILALPEADRAAVTPGAQYPAQQDYFTQNDWAYDNGRWGWSNTEGLVNHFMSLMYLRTGRRDLFFFIEANARHARDVDARHAGRWFGLGTRHGVQHWSDGNHEERQTTFTEQRFHYLLTGEARTREWNRVLTEGWFLKEPCTVHAAHSGRSYGLLTRWEMTGDAELGRTLREYMRALATPEGIAISTPVGFPEGKATGPAKGLNEPNMFFHCFGGMHAMLEYVYLTGDEAVAASLQRAADAALSPGSRGGAGDLLRKAVAYAARHAAAPEAYREALQAWCSGPGSQYAFQQVPGNPEHWTGETSYLIGNVSGGLFWANDALYVLGALPAEPALSAETLAEMAARDAVPRLPPAALPRGSWQDEYDRPEFSEYLRDHLNEPP